MNDTSRVSLVLQSTKEWKAVYINEPSPHITTALYITQLVDIHTQFTR